MYLSTDERQRALALSRGLHAASSAFAKGERSAGRLRSLARTPSAEAATSVDYVDVADADTIVPFDDGATIGDRALVAVACRVGKTRLIDNVVLGEDVL
jgi:pantoate--beta-alanine ligase